MARIIGVLGRQSGVGRTTISFQLGCFLARAGRRTVVYHADPGWPMHRMAGVAPEAGCHPVGERMELRLVEPPAAPWTPPPEGSLGLVDFPGTDPTAWPELLANLGDILLLLRPGPEAVAEAAACVDAVTGMMAARTRFSVRILGGLVTRVGRRTEDYERLLVAVERALPMEVYPFFIPEDPALSEPQGCLLESAPLGRATRGLVELTMEVQEDES